jgi:hypothetical protein
MSRFPVGVFGKASDAAAALRWILCGTMNTSSQNEPDSNLSNETTHGQIARRAYEIWEQEGCPEGRDHDHWLAAERQVLGLVERQEMPAAARTANPADTREERQPNPIGSRKNSNPRGGGGDSGGRRMDVRPEVGGGRNEDENAVTYPERAAERGRRR